MSVNPVTLSVLVFALNRLLSFLQHVFSVLQCHSKNISCFFSLKPPLDVHISITDDNVDMWSVSLLTRGQTLLKRRPNVPPTDVILRSRDIS